MNRPETRVRCAGVLLVLGALVVTTVAFVAVPGRGDAPGAPAAGTDEPQRLTRVTGEVRATTDADGTTEYVLEVAGSKEIELDAGPPWFHGEDHPLEPFVGETVTAVGERGTNWKGRQEIDVFSVVSNGQTIEIRRADGPPPWAAGSGAGGDGPGAKDEHPGCRGLDVAAAASGNETVVRLAGTMGCSGKE